MHWDAIPIAVTEYVPATQVVQTLEPTAAQLPGTHGVQFLELARAKDPMLHRVHAAEP